MRLLELSLLAYGSFTRRTLDLSQPAPAFHLIYGPNEAGKSTTLRAILGLLYGIDHKTADAYLHDTANLRIRGRLCDRHGTELVITRRKGVKNTLLDVHDQLLDEAALASMLGGLPLSVFRCMFGLDHERLRQGGEQLRRGQGDLGESLFQAGVGAPGVHRALQSLQEEAELLFKPKGLRPAINEAIKQYREARRRVRESAKQASGYREQEQQIAAEREHSAALQRSRRELLTEQSRLQRALRVLPWLARRAQLLEQRAAIGEIALLPESAASDRRDAQADLSACEAQLAQLGQRVATLAQRKQGLRLPESLIGLSPEFVHGIRMRLGSHLKASADQPRLRAELRAHELAAMTCLRELGHPVALDAVEELRIDVATQARIAELGGEHSGLRERMQAAERDLEAARSAAQAARAQLGLPPGREDEPLRLQLPSEGEVAGLARRFERSERERARLHDARARLDEREQRALQQLDTMAREGTPPTERELLEARAQRETSWQQIRARLEQGAREPASGLSAQHETLQQRSDELADRLRREASRVSQLAALQAERDAIARELARLAAQSEALAADEAALAEEWRRAWAPSGARLRPPAEMQPLLGKVSALLDDCESRRAEAEQRRKQALQALAAFAAEWSALMTRLRLPEHASVAQAQAVLDTLRRLFAEVLAMSQLRSRSDAIDRDAQKFEADVAGLVAEHAAELSSLAIAQAAEELTARYERARSEIEQRTRIDADLRDAAIEQQTLQQRADQAQRALSEFLRVANAADLGQLEELERSSQQARALELLLAEGEQELFELGEGAATDALIAETAGLSPDRIRARLEDIKEELEAINAEHEAVANKIGGLEAGLDRFRDDAAAEAAAEAEQHLSAVKSHAHAYLRRRLAGEILAREIRRYRDANQGPIVEHANALFARLTLGRYPRLQVGYDAQDEPVLLCVDAQARGVPIEGLSDGARDQLYLALRLATLRLFAERAEPMPLVLDDVLIHFDDERARAALLVLAEFAATTQVLFFTHHARIVELARDAIPADHLIEHRLAEDRPPPQQLLLEHGRD